MTHLAVISSGRPGNVAAMLPHVGEATWYVGPGEAETYLRAGAAAVTETASLVDARNAALERAFASDEPCVQVSDDLKQVSRMRGDTLHDTPLPVLLAEMADAAARLDARLAGAAPTYNAFYFDSDHPLRTHHFIVGDLIWVAPSEPRFDPALRLKEDYDFTAQHIVRYGAVARCDWVQARFAHRSNPGGAVAYRTAELEQEAIARLREKWGSAIVLNRRRPNEVLFRGLPLLARHQP